MREERGKLGYSQEAFAEAIGLSRDGVAKIEGNTSKTRAETLYRISVLTGKPMEYFMAGTYPEFAMAEVRQAAELVESTMEELKCIAGSLRLLGDSDQKSPSRNGHKSNQSRLSGPSPDSPTYKEGDKTSSLDESFGRKGEGGRSREADSDASAGNQK